MRISLAAVAALLLLSFAAPAQTADQIIAKYIEKSGGYQKIQAIKSVRTTSKFTGGGGFEAVIVSERKRPNQLRQEFQIQGMAATDAYDGKTGWKINPFEGKKDAESLAEDELKSIIESSDFDGPLVDLSKKGNKVEYLGKEDFDGSEVFKLKVTLANGTIKNYFLDTEYYLPLKVETKQFIRGTEVESETILGDYKEVGGVYFPFSSESGAKGSQNKVSEHIEKFEINVDLPDSRFTMPPMPAAKRP